MPTTRRLTRVVFVVLGTIIVLIVLHALGWLRPIEGLAAKGFTILERSAFSAGRSIRTIGDRFRSAAIVREENQTLQERLEKTTAELARIEGELNDLRTAVPQLNAMKSRGFQTVLARIIGKVTDQQRYLIDRGENDGVVRGTAAIVGDGILVGKIDEVNPSTAHVLILTDTQSAVAARVSSDRGPNGLVRGSHNLTLTLNLIPQDEPISVGDRVVTAGLEPSVPADLLIGEIETIETKPGDLYQSARLRPSTSFDHLRVISVVIPQQ